MKNLIEITTNEKGIQLVSARELYSFLEIKKDFTDWSKRMFSYGFEEDRDFTPVWGKSSGGRPSIDYALKIDTAKEIAMIQKSDKGKEARQYFIACEKALKEVAKPKSTLDFLQYALDEMKVQEARLTVVEERVLQIEAQSATRPDYLTIMGYAILSKVKVSLTMAAQLGRKAKALCTQKGYHVDKIRDPRFGEVGVYPTEVLKQVFGEAG